jgi:hypothetical protein
VLRMLLRALSGTAILCSALVAFGVALGRVLPSGNQFAFVAQGNIYRLNRVSDGNGSD